MFSVLAPDGASLEAGSIWVWVRLDRLLENEDRGLEYRGMSMT